MGIPGPGFLHLQAMVLIAIAAALAFRRFSGRKSAFQSSVAGVLVALAFGQFHEIAALAMNPWSLSPSALRQECAAEMTLNLAGAMAAGLLLAAAAGALAVLRKILPPHFRPSGLSQSTSDFRLSP